MVTTNLPVFSANNIPLDILSIITNFWFSTILVKLFFNTKASLVNISINNGNNSTVPPAYPTGKVVNKLVYILLALFLGGIGAHKFYSGKYGMGIVYLVFFWTGIPALCAVVDLIIVCFKPSDQNGNIVI